jgi:hypothetical protein
VPRGLDISLEAEGAGKAAHELALISHRMIHLEPAKEPIMKVFEAGELRHFNRLRGRYVLTGATKASLTEGGPDAIREAHGDEFTFGTSVFYARFLRKGRRSAVLVLQPAAKKAATLVLADHVMGRL